jgi:glycosyltransferase involved in cell wall biosynthesis
VTSLVAILNFKATRRDPRVRRVARTLLEAGHRVTVIEQRMEGEPSAETLDGFEVRRVEVPRDRGVEAMRGIDRAVPEAAAILRAVQPDLLDREIRAAVPAASLIERARRGLVRRGFTLYVRARERLVPPSLEQAKAVLLDDELLRIRSTLLTNLELYHAALALAPDAVHSNDMDTLLAGVMLKRSRSIPLIYDAHEIYAEQQPPRLRSALWHDVFTALEAKLPPLADARMTVCDSIGRWFSRRGPSNAFTTVLNVPSIRFLPDASVLERRNRPPRFLYHGSYAPYRGLEEVIAAVGRIPASVAQFAFRGVGRHENALRKRVAELGVEDRVRFEPGVPVDALIPEAARFDVGLNPFVSVCLNTEFALPNKFFEYMMAGLAVASSDLVEMRSLTRALDIGILLPSLEPDALAASFESLARDAERLDASRRRAYQAAKEAFHWELEEKKVLSLYRGLLG